MAKVYAVTHFRHERKLKWRWLARLTGLDDVRLGEYVIKIFDTEDKAKDFIRKIIAMDHELNTVRRANGLDTYDYELNEDNLTEYGYNYSYKHDENGIRTTVWYEYRSCELL